MANCTTHAEFTAIADAAPEILFLSRLIEETHSLSVLPICIYEDNSSCISVCSKSASRDRLKYLETKILDVTSYFEAKELEAVKIGFSQSHSHNSKNCPVSSYRS